MRKNEGLCKRNSLTKIKKTMKSTNAHMNRERFALKWLDRTSNAHTDCVIVHTWTTTSEKQAHTWATTWPLVHGLPAASGFRPDSHSPKLSFCTAIFINQQTF